MEGEGILAQTRQIGHCRMTAQGNHENIIWARPSRRLHLLTRKIDALNFSMQDMKPPSFLKGANGYNDIIHIGPSICHCPQERSEQRVVVPIHDQNTGIISILQFFRFLIEFQRRSQATKPGPKNEYAQAGLLVRLRSLTCMLQSMLAITQQFPANEGRSSHRRTQRQFFPHRLASPPHSVLSKKFPCIARYETSARTCHSEKAQNLS